MSEFTDGGHKAIRRSSWLIDADGNLINTQTVNGGNALQVAVGKDAGLSISDGSISDLSKVHKFGRNPDIPNAVGTFEAIWNGGGDYTGHDPTVAETLEVFSSSVEDAGTLLSSGTATGGSATTIVDENATFLSDGVAVGDVAINDTIVDHGIVSAVTETQLTFLRMGEGGSSSKDNAYRVATKAATGVPVIELYQLLGPGFVVAGNEYIIMNGQTGVDTVGTYIRNTRAHSHGGNNIGTITCRQKTTTANITMFIPVGYNTTMIAAFTVPAGKRGFIDAWGGGLAGKTNANCNLRILVRPVSDVFQVKEEFSVQGTGTSWRDRSYRNPKNGISEMSDVKVMADSNTNSTAIAAYIDLTLKDM